MVELEQMREKYQLQERVELLGAVRPGDVRGVSGEWFWVTKSPFSTLYHQSSSPFSTLSGRTFVTKWQTTYFDIGVCATGLEAKALV